MPAAAPSDWDLFRSLLPRQEIDALDPRASQATYTAFVVLWMLVFQRLEGNASLHDAVAEMLQRFPASSLPPQQAKRLEDLSSGTAAYSAARSALAPAVLEHAASRSFDSLSSCYPPSFKGRRVFLLDGTSVTLAAEPALRKAFPPCKNQHGESPWPVLRLLVANDLDSGLVARTAHGPMYGPAATSELGLARELLPGLPAGSILLADRNFGVFGVAWAARQAGLGVVTRLTGTRFEAMLKQAVPDGPGKWRLCWKPSRADRRSDPSLPADARIEGWLHEADIGEGGKLWLLATEEATTEELAALYKRRGEVETDIRDLKKTLDLDRMKGRSVEMVEKELLAARVAYNLANQVRRLAAKEAGVPARKLGFAGTWSLVKAFLGVLAEGLSGPEAEKRFKRLLRQAGQRKLPDRPGRSYPRKVLGRRKGFPVRKPSDGTPKA